MDNINASNEQEESQSIFTRSEVDELLCELEERRETKKQLQVIGSDLPVDISKTLDGQNTSQLKEIFKQYKKGIYRNNHGEWTTAEQINKEFIPELKNSKVDAYQLVHTVYKITESTRIQARESTELFEQLHYLQYKAEFGSSENRDIFNNTIDQAQQLAVFSYGSAKEAAIKALKLPTSIKHLEPTSEEDGKKNSFDNEFVE